ncbi:hypothetical protein BU14_0066s0004 [Porphyra umbilicalis]|uniref:Uncharacterized protein n=1 Tax=Porphyra umbilicalis TaxID=2786 RepID=A0A1X6PGH4_PORUM|nr:hypothetical protein BU14_0066s0004 [Porphyra umbilicalis]|eukprot:OSX79951.1 hypothetical protein BU14_0066s0004 [Porphyra umbilicalis]
MWGGLHVVGVVNGRSRATSTVSRLALDLAVAQPGAVLLPLGVRRATTAGSTASVTVADAGFPLGRPVGVHGSSRAGQAAALGPLGDRQRAVGGNAPTAAAVPARLQKRLPRPGRQRISRRQGATAEARGRGRKLARRGPRRRRLAIDRLADGGSTAAGTVCQRVLTTGRSRRTASAAAAPRSGGDTVATAVPSPSTVRRHTRRWHSIPCTAAGAAAQRRRIPAQRLEGAHARQPAGAGRCSRWGAASIPGRPVWAPPPAGGSGSIRSCVWWRRRGQRRQPSPCRRGRERQVHQTPRARKRLAQRRDALTTRTGRAQRLRRHVARQWDTPRGRRRRRAPRSRRRHPPAGGKREQVVGGGAPKRSFILLGAASGAESVPRRRGGRGHGRPPAAAAPTAAIPRHALALCVTWRRRRRRVGRRRVLWRGWEQRLVLRLDLLQQARLRRVPA